MGDSFVHLHVHTEYSMLDGAARLKELFAETSRLGMPALAMTDHGNLFGAYDFHKQAKAAGVKEILGIEAYVAPRSRHHKKPVFWGSGGKQVDPNGENADVSGAGAYTHLTMFAANATGLRNLFTLSTLASFEGFYRHPRMDMELIAEHSEGIIATTGCPGGAVQTRLRLGQYDEAVKAAGQMRDIFGPENLFVEVMDHGLDVERQTRDGLLRLGKQLGLRPLATNDLHYVHERDAARHDAVLCVGAGAQLADAKRFRFSGSGYYLKSAAQMRALFDAEIPGACDNTLLVADRVESYGEVFSHVDRMPHFDGLPDGETEESWLRKLVDEGRRRKRGPNPPREAVERAANELDLIVGTGFPGYFLVVHDICAFMRRKGIRFGLRGSAGGSEVVYLLDISPVDPIEHGLLFERFINPERVSPPDVDIDIDERRRGEVVEYATRRYGADRVCQIMNVGRIGAKTAAKDAARVLGLPFSIGDEISGAMPTDLFGKAATLADCFNEASSRYRDAQAVRDLYRDNAEAKKVIDIALGFEGLPRQLGVHACGSVISSRPLLGDLPMFMRQEDGAIISGFPMEQLDELGFYKMDFLGLRNWTVLDDAVRHVERTRGVRVDLDSLPFDDEATYALLARGETLGVFQLEGSGITALLRAIMPDRYGDIVACLALFRPGPMGVDAHTAYAHRKNGRQKVEPIHPELADALADILGPTYGLIVFQEQVLAIAREVAGYSLGKADLLRKAMGKKKKEVLDKEFVPFAAGMKERGYSDEAVKALWDTLVPFADYAFGKCVAGDTRIARLGRGGHRWDSTVRDVANRIHGREDYDGTGCAYCYGDAPASPQSKECKPCKSWRAKWRMTGGMNAAGRVGDRILPVKVVDVFRQGVQPVWRITLSDGRSITSTANHRHLTPAGWRTAGTLAVGDPVCVMGPVEPGRHSPRSTYSCPGTNNWIGVHGYYVAERAYGKNGPFLHGRNAQFKANTAVLERRCAHCGATDKRLDRAHLDGNPLNNEPGNLAMLCGSCHRRHDYANGGRVKMWRKGRSIEVANIVSIEYLGEEMTYDVTVDSEDHSWVANDGIVTHNSHTTTYGRIAYLTAYMKAHYPTEYMASLLTSVGDEKGKLALYLAECRRLGIKVLPPDVNVSGADFTPDGGNIRFGLAAIRNVGAGAVEAILKSRPAGGYTGFGHFLHVVDQAACTKKVVDALIKAGAFDSLGHKRRGLHIEHEAMVELAAKLKKNAAGGQLDLFAVTAPADDAVPPGLDCDFEPVEWDEDKLLADEREMLGLYVSRHPLAGDADRLARVSSTSIAALLAAGDDGLPQRVTIAGLVTNLERKISKKNKPYARVMVEDLDAEVPVLLFNGVYDAYGLQLARDQKVVVDASVKRDGEGVTLFASRVRPLDQVTGARRSGPSGRTTDAGPKPVTLRVPYHEITKGLLHRLKELFARYPGASPVLVELTGGDRTQLHRLPFTVGDCEEFRDEFRALRDVPRLRRAA